MQSETKYLTEMENSKGPEDGKERRELEIKMKFNYWQALGEILYAMVTCRPDILVAITKLSQYSQNPSEIHYIALKKCISIFEKYERGWVNILEKNGINE